MESLLFSKRLLDYLEQYKEIDMLIKREITKGTLGIFGDFIYDVSDRRVQLRTQHLVGESPIGRKDSPPVAERHRGTKARRWSPLTTRSLGAWQNSRL